MLLWVAREQLCVAREQLAGADRRCFRRQRSTAALPCSLPALSPPAAGDAWARTRWRGCAARRRACPPCPPSWLTCTFPSSRCLPVAGAGAPWGLAGGGRWRPTQLPRPGRRRPVAAHGTLATASAHLPPLAPPRAQFMRTWAEAPTVGLKQEDPACSVRDTGLFALAQCAPGGREPGAGGGVCSGAERGAEQQQQRCACRAAPACCPHACPALAGSSTSQLSTLATVRLLPPAAAATAVPPLLLCRCCCSCRHAGAAAGAVCRLSCPATLPCQLAPSARPALRVAPLPPLRRPQQRLRWRARGRAPGVRAQGRLRRLRPAPGLAARRPCGRAAPGRGRRAQARPPLRGLAEESVWALWRCRRGRRGAPSAALAAHARPLQLARSASPRLPSTAATLGSARKTAAPRTRAPARRTRACDS